MRAQQLPESLGQIFSVRDARDAGVTRSRLRAADLAKPFHGIRAVELDEADPLDRARALVPRLRPGRMFSHVTAALFYDLRLPFELEHEHGVHVAAMHPVRPQRGRGVISHKLMPGSTVPRTWRGLPVVDPVTAWIQLAPRLTVDQLVVAGDALVRRVQPLATLDEMLARVSRLRGVHGRSKLIAAGPLVRALTDSAAETRLRLLLVRSGLPEPAVGFVIRRANGDFIATPDLAYVAQRVALEYDGDLHRTSKRRFRDDISRYELMQDEGWRVIRVIPEDLTYRSRVLVSRVQAALQRVENVSSR